MNCKLNKYSSRITELASQGASQAMLYATGLNDEDFLKPQIGIVSMWYEGNPCNMHLLSLSEKVKEGVTEAGLVGMRFNTIGVSDGISMGTEGMSYSLQSRDLIADSIETVVSAQWYDGCLAIPGCDKNLPGCLIALGRLNRPGFLIYGGTIQPGSINNQPIDIVSAFQCYGEYLAGKINDVQRKAIIKKACPGAGACGGMYTANTMACAVEAMGMSLPYSSSIPAKDSLKLKECFQSGFAIKKLLEKEIKPRDIMTPKAFENAMVLITILGGSTNAVLHLLAVAKSVGVPLNLDDFQNISNRIPVLADFKPSGKYTMADLHHCGGTPAVMKMLLHQGLLHGDCITATGETLAENLNKVPDLSRDQKIIHSFENPIKQTGHLQILKGNLAPEGAVAKVTGKEGLHFRGKARVFNSEEEMLAALEKRKIFKGDVVVIRYEGPKGGPGMPEMLGPTSAIMGAGLGKDVALITDGRLSGGSHGFIIGHISPEAQVGGLIALVEDDDYITIDIDENLIHLEVSEELLQKRKSVWKMPEYKVIQGTLYKYIKNVSSASMGCITDA
ncbi:dihydroxy-acid dehydratase [Silvanigrella aquatica]|uniref:Dihydroxy-acid dehydratase n=1 Tax=Silvanigrella aquatica TaxID=1915309 RepID=A0A1L4CYV8_9BACT|nr:dihydroxy-acid dehydratase [Silvanigrella aquatica]APJ03120.1 dihydroxy-acid dehydratase [Silvanigrella aquatica]